MTSCLYKLIGIFQNVTSEDGSKTEENMEISFEYLLSKENLHWITIYSDQVVDTQNYNRATTVLTASKSRKTVFNYAMLSP